MATMTVTETMPSRRNDTAACLTTTTSTSTASVSKTMMITSENQLRPLHCAAQQYEWGRLGSSSTVARMKDAQACQENDDENGFSIDEMAPYAELWLGTHPSGMSHVTCVSDKELNGPEQHKEHRQSLLEYVQTNPELHCGASSATDLSFLLKILSVRKVLSIQAHPDKKLAEQLHRDFPHIYKDPNHKPEMAIALSDQVRAMCGFRPLSEIAAHLHEYPEFRSLIGHDTAQEVFRVNAKFGNVKSKEAAAAIQPVLQRVFCGYIEAEPHVIQEHVEQMVSRLQAMDGYHDDVQKLILQLEEQFPADCGIFSPLLFNIVTMRAGEALFIDANEPHAYVSGEIIECMACSDNVVRAGLTPKLKDIPTLVNMLTYQTGLPQTTFGETVDDCIRRYLPPVADFLVEIIDVPTGQVYELNAVASPSVILTMDGDATLKQSDRASLDVSFGSAAFFSANTTCQVLAGPYGVRLTRACSNVYHETSQA